MGKNSILGYFFKIGVKFTTLQLTVFLKKTFLREVLGVQQNRAEGIETLHEPPR